MYVYNWSVCLRRYLILVFLVNVSGAVSVCALLLLFCLWLLKTAMDSEPSHCFKTSFITSECLSLHLRFDWQLCLGFDGAAVLMMDVVFFFVNVLTNVFDAEVKSDTFEFVFYFSWPMSWSRSFLLLWCHHVAVLYDPPWISEGSLMQKDATWTCLRTPRLSTRPHLHLFWEVF